MVQPLEDRGAWDRSPGHHAEGELKPRVPVSHTQGGRVGGVNPLQPSQLVSPNLSEPPGYPEDPIGLSRKTLEGGGVHFCSGHKNSTGGWTDVPKSTGPRLGRWSGQCGGGGFGLPPVAPVVVKTSYHPPPYFPPPIIFLEEEVCPMTCTPNP